MSKLEEISAAIEKGRGKQMSALVSAALEEGCDPNEILGSMIRAMDTVGELFSANEIFVAEMLMSARAMKLGVQTLAPALSEGETSKLGKVIIGTAAGDMHDIGKNLVALMFESSGFEVVDLGVDIAPETFVSAVEENPDAVIVAVSALLTSSMPNMRETVRLLNEMPCRSNFKVMVGGAPISQNFADEIGADAYTADAAEAARCAKQLVAG